mmetsp:Transcript_70917/g.219224  ORF Transcript_70917/g.219224 Transcript_70917/m.219224 type:complete len:234 (+) Transcript_70917:63-764(+)
MRSHTTRSHPATVLHVALQGERVAATADLLLRRDLQSGRPPRLVARFIAGLPRWLGTRAKCQFPAYRAGTQAPDVGATPYGGRAGAGEGVVARRPLGHAAGPSWRAAFAGRTGLAGRLAVGLQARGVLPRPRGQPRGEDVELLDAGTRLRLDRHLRGALAPVPDRTAGPPLRLRRGGRRVAHWHRGAVCNAWGLQWHRWQRHGPSHPRAEPNAKDVHGIPARHTPHPWSTACD